MLLTLTVYRTLLTPYNTSGSYSVAVFITIQLYNTLGIKYQQMEWFSLVAQDTLSIATNSMEILMNLKVSF